MAKLRESTKQRIAEAKRAHLLKCRGADVADIAGDLGIAETTVYKRLRLAREMMGDQDTYEARADAEKGFNMILADAYKMLEDPELESRERVQIQQLIRNTLRDKVWLLGGAMPSKTAQELEGESAT